MSKRPRYLIRPARWAHDCEALLAVRTTVFVEEQAVPMDLERDGFDPQCEHALALLGTEPVGAGRVTAAGHIGRIAVLAEHRGCGIGTSLIRCLVDTSAASQIDLNAQVHAVGFYEGLGFEVVGETFMEAGIEHVRMVLGQTTKPSSR